MRYKLLALAGLVSIVGLIGGNQYFYSRNQLAAKTPSDDIESPRSARNSELTVSSNVGQGEPASVVDGYSVRQGESGEMTLIEPLASPLRILPSVGGFEIPPSVGRNNNPAVALAAESIDSKWASTMENVVVQAISEVIDGPVSMIQVECRSTMCGILILAAGDSLGLFEDDATIDIALPLARRLGFSRASMITAKKADGTKFAGVYLRDANRSTNEPQSESAVTN